MSRRSRAPESSSFLVRIWRERRERDGQERPERFYFRNLQTGEEQYLADGEKLAEALLRQTGGERPEQEDGISPVESRVG